MAFIPVIKYNGPKDVIVWKYPNEELSTWTQIIVNEAQEAALVKCGQLITVFSAGRHTLSTANIPFLKKIVNIPFGGRSPFTAEVWYVNRAHKLDIVWGTPTPVQVQDPRYGIIVPVRVNGTLGIQIKDTERFLTQIVGTVATFSEKNIIQAIRGLYISKVKDAIAQYVIVNKICTLELNAYIDEISQKMKKVMYELLNGYGIEIIHFSINDISVPDDDPSVASLRASLAKRADMNVAGYTYGQERTFDVFGRMAKNDGTISSALMSAGLGLSIGNSFGTKLNQMTTMLLPNEDYNIKVKCNKCGSLQNQSSKFCDKCGNPFFRVCQGCGNIINEDSKFCPNCGEKV